jgi:anaerobic selenocysteine-containing dehydrogenase
VLPAKGPFEKTGTTTNVTGEVLPVNAAASLEIPPGALSDLEMLVGLAGELGVTLPSVEELDATVIAKLAAAPEPFTFGDDRFARVKASGASTPLGGGDGNGALRVVMQTRIFAGGGTSAHDERIGELRCLPEAAISAADAAALGVNTGDYIDLESDGRTMHDLLVEVRASMPSGVVALIDGLPDDPANLFGENALAKVVNVRSSALREPVGAK